MAAPLPSVSLQGDFGLSKIVDEQDTMKTVCGTPGYCGEREGRAGAGGRPGAAAPCLRPCTAQCRDGRRLHRAREMLPVPRRCFPCREVPTVAALPGAPHTRALTPNSASSPRSPPRVPVRPRSGYVVRGCHHLHPVSNAAGATGGGTVVARCFAPHSPP